MPVEIRELVFKANVPTAQRKEAADTTADEEVQDAEETEEKAVARPKNIPPEWVDTLITLCVARLRELEKRKSFR